MRDSKSVVAQAQDLQILIHEMHAERLGISEPFQVAAMVAKLPPSWSNFQNYLMHKRKEMTVEDLIVRLRIEEDNRGKEKQFAVAMSHDLPKANLVEAKKAKKPVGPKLGPKGAVSKKAKFIGKCYNCGKMGHKSSDCRLAKKVKPVEANVVEAIA